MYVRDKLFFLPEAIKLYLRDRYMNVIIFAMLMLNQSHFFWYLYELNLFGFPFFYIKTKCTRKIDILAEIILQLVFFLRCNKFRRQSGI